MKIFNREPALWLALVAALVQVTSQFVFPLDQDLQAAINALAAALFGLLTAWSVRDGKVAAAVIGLITALLTLTTALGGPVSEVQNGAVSALLTSLLALFVRTQATARVNSQGQDVGPAPEFATS